MQRFIIADGVAIRISDTGTGERTVLLLHGFLESLDIWEEFTELLVKAGLRVVSLDLPGHGISEIRGEVHTMPFLADVAVGVLDAVGVKSAVVVGHSMGGYVGLEILRRHSDRVLGLVLFSSTPNVDTPEKRNDRERMITIIQSGRKEMLMGNSALSFAKENRHRCAAEIKELDEQLYVSEDAGIISLLRGMSEREDANELLHNSPQPQLFIFGEQDELLPLETTHQIAVAHPQASVVFLAHSAHNGFLEQPDESAEAIIRFISNIA